MRVLTAFLSFPEFGETEKFVAFLKRELDVTDVSRDVLQRRGVHFRFTTDKSNSTEDLEDRARLAGFKAEFFTTEHEEGVS